MNANPDLIKRVSRGAGFDLVGITPATPTVEALFYPTWLEQGYAGDMNYLKGRRGGMRADPRTLLPTARSIICLGLVYNAKEPYSTDHQAPGTGWVSRYAWGDDYHAVMRAKMREVVSQLTAQLGPFDSKIAVDTSPLLERAYAHHAGLGWIGKNTCLINEKLGSWVFLGEILTSLEIEGDDPAPFRCGTCTRCVEACPTDAIVPAETGDGPSFALDSRLCISYWTIELRGQIPEHHREGIGNHLFGCDICQDVCPWNRPERAAATDAEEFAARNGPLGLAAAASLTEQDFAERFRESPIERARHRGFLRNVAVAMGNSGEERFRRHLQALARHEDPLVKEHAEWGLRRLEAESQRKKPA